MAVSVVSICNLALSKIGVRSKISSIDAAGILPETCKIHYEHTRDVLLQSHLWNFAMSRKALSRNAVAPVFEYTYQYLLPADCLRVVSMYNESAAFKVEGSNLLTNATAVNLKYISRITNELLFTPLFIESLATRLAAEMEEEITGSTDKSNKLNGEFKVKFKEAKRRDGQEGTPDRVISRGPADFKFDSLT